MNQVPMGCRTLATAALAWCCAMAAAVEVLPRPQEITPQAETAINRGLAFLARTQGRDGSWRSGAIAGSYPTTMTALAGLALLAGGNTPHEGPNAAAVRRAVDYLLACAGRDGLIARIEEDAQPMYGHGFAMLFLAESLGLEDDPARMAVVQQVLQRAVVLTGRAQSAAGGWIYTPDSGGDEGSVTVTQIQGLRACRNAGIKVPKAIIDRACSYIEHCANQDGGISYSLASRGQSRFAITAAAVSTMYNAGAYENPVAVRALAFVKTALSATDSKDFWRHSHKYYSLLYTAQALYLSGEANWRDYFPRVRDELCTSQSEAGSWSGEVGEVYCTAIGLLTLLLPYRQLPILQR